MDHAEQRRKREVKFGRDAFLYLEPRHREGKKFAQCESCRMFLAKHDLCSLHGKNVTVTEDMSCGLYTPGGPASETELEHVSAAFTPEESGLVERQVRCENCYYGDTRTSSCRLFKMLGLPAKINPLGCCNAQMPRTA